MEVVALSSISVPTESPAQAVYTPPPAPRNRLGYLWRNCAAGPGRSAVAAAVGAGGALRPAHSLSGRRSTRPFPTRRCAWPACGCAAGPAAANRWTACCRRRSAWCAWRPSGIWVCGRSTCSWRPASSCTRAALAELATGEGKTLFATLPAFLNALAGKGVHVTTVNDYLARRDAEWIGPIYKASA